MGFNIKTSELLLYAKKLGVSFEQPITIGRQRLHGSRFLFKKLFKKYNIPANLLNELLKSDRYCEIFLDFLGAKKTDSIDASEYEKATIIHDMNQSISDAYAGKYSVVIDGGSLEHVFNFPVAIKNCMEMVRVGGHFIGIVPTNNFLGHGFYQFSPELFYRVFSKDNGFEIKTMILYFDDFNSPLYEVVDPFLVKTRVKLKNSKETYLFILAQKITSAVPFRSTPQQSDYEFVQWNQGSEDHHRRDSWIIRMARKMVYKDILLLALQMRKKVLHLRTLVSPIGDGNKKHFKRISL